MSPISRFTRLFGHADGKPRESAAPAPENTGAGRDFVNAYSSQPGRWDDPRDMLAQALRDDHFMLLQQRLHAFTQGESLVEVFVRLKEEEDNLLPPGGFFPLAEELGMMAEIDGWVVGHLISQVAARSRAESRSPLPRRYCNNLSSAAICSPEFVRFVKNEIIAKLGDGRTLCFEVDEAQVIEWPREVASLVGELAPLGCRFTIDAFGSVRGTFSQLRGLRFDHVKVDGVIIQNILRNPGELARLKAIHAVCAKLGMRTIAELVEDAATLECLRAVGIDYAQGFGVAPLEPLGTAHPA